jgi:subtilisin family serine protease
MSADLLLVAVLDSGVNPRHPHLTHVILEGFAAPDDSGHLDEAAPPCDVHGHGTAVTAAVFRGVQRGRLLGIRVLDARLTGHHHLLADAICLAARRGARLINVSMGTSDAAARPRLAEAVRFAQTGGAIVVAAVPPVGCGWPADLPGVLGAVADPACPPDRAHPVDPDRGLPAAPECALLRYRAHSDAIPPGGAARRGNLGGSSLAAGHLTGLVAALLTREPQLDLTGILQRLGPETEGGSPWDDV